MPDILSSQQIAVVRTLLDLGHVNVTCDFVRCLIATLDSYEAELERWRTRYANQEQVDG